MGLDMYLTAKRNLWDAKDKDTNNEIEGAYWRKANQIHRWFVNSVQDGKDDCGSYDVSQEDIKTLLDKCKQVLADRGQASVLLPSQSGFFFGDVEYDEYYFTQIENTVTMLGELLELPGDWSFEYHSSW